MNEAGIIWLAIVALLAISGPGCAAQSRGPVQVGESWQRVLWKTKHCGLGVSFAECERAWRER
jgi:hypothetical protein